MIELDEPNIKKYTVSVKCEVGLVRKVINS